ncbi:MAG: hypothetical protein IT373_35790 [Polyangiaceae bacterium]|nr:hypothetical protein [Polyangiaceae bacterium]
MLSGTETVTINGRTPTMSYDTSPARTHDGFLAHAADLTIARDAAHGLPTATGDRVRNVYEDEGWRLRFLTSAGDVGG